MEDRRFGMGVVVIIFNKDFSKILLLKRNKEKRERNKADWGNIGGKVEWGEKLKDAAIREVLEESNICLDSSKLYLAEIKEFTKNPINPNVHFLQFIYVTIIDENSKIKINE
ncbi:MAG: NUDIX hydrolase, partial [Candidatus Pacearchaeota archaeon]